MTISKAKKQVLLSANIDPESAEFLTTYKIVKFAYDNGQPIGEYNGKRVTVDANKCEMVQDGDIWVVGLIPFDEGYLADPISLVTVADILSLTDTQVRELGKCMGASSKKASDVFKDWLAEDSPVLKHLLEEHEEIRKEIAKVEKEDIDLKTKLDMEKRRYTTLKEAFEEAAENHKKEKQELTNRLATMKKQATASGDTTQLQKQIEALNVSIKDREGKIHDLEGQVANIKTTSDREIAKLTEERDTAISQKEAVVAANSNKTKLEARVSELEAENEALKARKEELEGELAEESARGREKESQYIAQIRELTADIGRMRAHDGAIPGIATFDGRRAIKPPFTVRRESANTLTSDYFTESRYTVVMSCDRSKLMVRPDINGKVRCKEYSLNIKSLEELAPMKGPRHYCDVTYDPGTGTLVVVL